MVCQQSLMIAADDYARNDSRVVFVRDGKTVGEFKDDDVNAIVKNPAGYDIADYV